MAGIVFWFFISTSSISIDEENMIENSIDIFGFENLSEESETYWMGEILQHLIISDLSGLTHLQVINSQRLLDIQKQMDENQDEKYAIDQLANAKVLLTGSTMDLSGKKILVGELINVFNGNVMKSHRINGTDIYSMVDDLTENIREDLDISKHKDDQMALSASAKTTHSLEAYDKYLGGLTYFNKLNYKMAVIKFEEAIAIDSTFFDAHYLSVISKW